MSEQLKKYPAVIMLHGGKESGKTYLAQRLWQWETERNPYQTPPIVSFAKPLKNACIDVYGHGSNFYETSLKGLKHPHSQHTSRHIMQVMGDTVRSLDPDIFPRKAVDFMQKWVHNVGGKGSVFVIDDLRLHIEADVMRRNFRHVYIIQVETDNGYTGEHDTERPLSKVLIDYKLTNDFTENSVIELHNIYQEIISIIK